MRNQTILLSLLAAMTSSGCKMVECADGTIERDGKCMPGDGDSVISKCGPFTHLAGDQCIPDFPPTVCESGAESMLDPETGVTTCLGGGLPPCGTAITCSKPDGATKQSFCGQISNFQDNTPISDPVGTPGELCNENSTSPACKLQVLAYDALVFADNPTTPPLAMGEIDNCGRFRLKDVEVGGTGPFIGIGLDDATGLGGTGETVTVAVAVNKQGGVGVNNIEHWIVKPATVGMWVGSGGPPFSMSAGIYAAVFRAHKPGSGVGMASDLQTGVTIQKNGADIPANDFYFSNTDTTRTTIGSGLTATGTNGTVLVTGGIPKEGLVYAARGGLGAGCEWDPHAGASLPGIVFIQIFRKKDVFGQTCMD